MGYLENRSDLIPQFVFSGDFPHSIRCDLTTFHEKFCVRDGVGWLDEVLFSARGRRTQHSDK